MKKNRFRRYNTKVNGKSLRPLGRCINPKDAPPDIDIGLTTEELFPEKKASSAISSMYMKAFARKMRSKVKWPVYAVIPISSGKADLAHRKIVDTFGKR